MKIIKEGKVAPEIEHALKQLVKLDINFYVTGGCPALGLLYSKNGDYYHEDILKCIFFENGWYDRINKELQEWHLYKPLDI